MFFSDIQLVIKKILFSKLDVRMKKKMATLNNSKNFTTIFDHQFDINEKQNWWTSETILGFQTSFPHPGSFFFLLFHTMTPSNLYFFCLIYIIFVCVCVYMYIYYIYIYIMFFRYILLLLHVKEYIYIYIFFDM